MKNTEFQRYRKLEQFLGNMISHHTAVQSTLERQFVSILLLLVPGSLYSVADALNIQPVLAFITGRTSTISNI